MADGFTYMQTPKLDEMKLDMSTKLKLQSLAQQFWSVDPELLRSVFLHCDCNTGRTIQALTEIDPTVAWKLRSTVAQPQGPSKGEVEPLKDARKAHDTQPIPPAENNTQPSVAERRAKERRERRRQEKFTVVSRKKRHTRGEHARIYDENVDLRQAALDHAAIRLASLHFVGPMLSVRVILTFCPWPGTNTTWKRREPTSAVMDKLPRTSPCTCG